MTDAPLPLVHRIWFAFVCFFRVLIDGAFARRAVALAAVGASDLPASPPQIEASALPQPDAALSLLAIFQREGRLVDFLRQDIDAFGDAEIGSAARVVHAGCRRVLSSHFDVVPVRDEAEGTTITVLAGEAGAVKLTGNVSGAPPYRGILRHAGWRVRQTTLPDLAPGHDVTIVCAAEVEL